MATNKTKAELEKENSELASQIQELKAMIGQIKESMKSDNQNQQVSNVVYTNDDDIQITVISLCNNQLNLSTGGNGHGEIYTFSHFGEEQNIPRSDLKKIVKNNKNFTTSGLYYIADKDFVASEHLVNAYKSIVDSEKIKSIIKSDKETFKKVFGNITDSQKQTIAEMFINMIANDEEVDMNIVKVCGDMIGKDLNSAAESIKASRNI